MTQLHKSYNLISVEISEEEASNDQTSEQNLSTQHEEGKAVTGHVVVESPSANLVNCGEEKTKVSVEPSFRDAMDASASVSTPVKEDILTGVSSRHNQVNRNTEAAVTSKVKTKKNIADKQLKEDVKQIMQEEMREQLGETPNVPFARMRYIIVVLLILLLIGFGVYYAFIM